MTQDEVMALTDEELRVKAAELVGWSGVFYDSSFEGLLGYPPNTNREGYKVPPDYPHDIAAAWELVNERGIMGFCIVEKADGWEAMFPPAESAHADTAPLAITRAFVLAMSNEAH